MKKATIEKVFSYCTYCPHCECYGMTTEGSLYSCKKTGSNLIPINPRTIPTLIVIPDNCPLEDVK